MKDTSLIDVAICTITGLLVVAVAVAMRWGHR